MTDEGCAHLIVGVLVVVVVEVGNG